LATKAFISAEAEKVFVAFFVLLPTLEKGGMGGSERRE